MTQQLTCTIVDDEPLAQNLLEKFISKVSFLSLKGKFDNAIEAIDGIAELKPDIIFLDIRMPEMTGIEFLKSFTHHHPYIIMTTAYPQYALEGFEYNALDYLLKPIAFSRFMKAIHKVIERSQLGLELPILKEANASDTISEKLEPIKEKFFMVKTDKKLVKVNVEDIVFVEGMKDYIKIHFDDHFIIVHMTMKKIAELLPSSQFIRINRSFIVRIASIKLLEGNMVETSSGEKLTIGINYRDEVKDIFKTWTIQ
jgi:two-component system, LytTR family, response regulator